METNRSLLLAHTVSPEWSQKIAAELTGRLPTDAIKNAMTPAETLASVESAEMLVAGQFELEWLDRARRLQLVQTLWAGVDMYPLDSIEEADVWMANAAGVHARPIAEQVLGYMLQFERGLNEATANHRRGVWESIRGGELGTKTVGIIGVGAIGSRVTELVSAFGAETIGTKRDTTTVPDALDQVFPADEYHKILTQADYVVVACPLTDETEGLLGIDEFRLMSRESVLINVARGEIVDQDDLVRALQHGLIDGAALDVFDEEPLPPDSLLWDLSNVVVTPHMAWTTSKTTDRWADLIAENYDALTASSPKNITNRVL
ncbi:D-2-hydroxyacid dehydrogenase [Halovenus salina]|uniref:D-2-hydroxyacid dehydrogenase n=1 Tax=Halovenus salina TaxID=1510225 RepID=UPI002260A594|nr:D-2-hydroxyacid dehydrogenase [Halovenus salina]